MQWPEYLKVGGSFWRLVMGRRDIVDHGTSEYYGGEANENKKTIEVSAGEDPIDIFLHEKEHAIQVHAGTYASPNRAEDKGDEDEIAHREKMILTDNPRLYFELIVELQPPHLRDEFLRYAEKRIREIRTAPIDLENTKT